ncbi:MAG: hypothetical protein V2I62_00250 [Bacteroidales bacterium]|nr:hypothetical protein [Bacteroidales bacterium]
MKIMVIKKKATGIYMMVIGLSVIVAWMMILGFESPKEGKIELIFHLISEFVMASICIVGGLGLLLDRERSKLIISFGLGALIYSIINASGFYLENGSIITVIIFIVLLLVSIMIAYRILKSTNNLYV